MAELQSNLEKFTGSVQELADLMREEHEDFAQITDEKKEFFDGISDAARDMSREHATSAQKIREDVKSISKKYEELRESMVKAGGLKGVVGEMMPQQLTGMQTGISKIKGSILSELPAGGLFGLMMLGGLREEEVRSKGTEVTRMFQQAGQVGQRQISQVSSTVRELGVALGKGPTGLAAEVATSAQAFAQAGVDIQDVLNNKFTIPIQKSRGSILETAVALDSLFKLGAGTSARMMSQMIRDFNLDATESAKVFAAVGLAARDSETSVTAFTSSVMRSAAALRTQRVDITEVAEAQLELQKSMEAGGMRPQMAAAYAERGIQQVTQGLAGLSVGLSAVLGERISARMAAEQPGSGAQPVSGLEAYFALREGFGGAGQQPGEGAGMFAESIKELAMLAAEGNRSEAEQRFFLEKMAGVSTEGSKAIVEVGKAIESGMDVDEAIKKNQGDLNRAFVDRAQETSSFQRSLLRVQNGIAKVGAGLLSAMISGFQMLGESLKYIVSLLSGDETAKREAAIALSTLSDRSTRAFDLIGKGFEETWEGMKIGFGTVVKGTDASKQERQMPDEFIHALRGMRGEDRQRALEKANLIEIPAQQRTPTRPGERPKQETVLIEKDELDDVRERAQNAFIRRAKSQLRETLRTTTDMPYELIRELTNMYEVHERKTGKGEEWLEKQLRSRDVRTKFHKEGERGAPVADIVAAEEQAAGRTILEIGGRKVTVNAILKLQPVAIEEKAKPKMAEGS